MKIETMHKRIDAGLGWIKANWSKVADKAQDLRPEGYRSNRKHSAVILLLNRQKPSVEASYNFNEERFGINKDGLIIWGFDSGCSCPSPWKDSYPECYKPPVKTWKQFTLDALPKFDVKFADEVLQNMATVGVPKPVIA